MANLNLGLKRHLGLVDQKSWGHEAPSGPPSKRTAGGWLADMAAMSKAIFLCDLCVGKWNPHGYDYEATNIWPGQTFVNSKCDACKLFTRCTLHMPKGS